MERDGNQKEVRREDKQVKSLKRLKRLESKGKTKTNRYEKLKEKVYNPFAEQKTGKRKAVKKFKKGYDDLGKVKSGEYDNEKRESYFTGGFLKRGVIAKLPMDDADRTIEKGVKKRRLGKNFK
jgi:hypothetical protein